MRKATTQSKDLADPKAALDTLTDNVYLPIFFAVLAERYGIGPITAKEVHDLVDLAVEIGSTESQTEVQSVQSNAQRTLDQQLSALGLDNNVEPANAQHMEIARELAADLLAVHPNLYHAVKKALITVKE